MTGCLFSPSTSSFCLLCWPHSVWICHLCLFLLQHTETISTLCHPAAGGAAPVDLHWLLWAILYHWHGEKKKKDSELSLIHQTGTCQTVAQENRVSSPSFSPSPTPVSLFSPWQITVMSQPVRGEWWSAIRPPFSIKRWTHSNPSEHALWKSVAEVQPGWHSGYTIKYNTPEHHWHQPPGLDIGA